jgi:hypothetical protein
MANTYAISAMPGTGIDTLEQTKNPATLQVVLLSATVIAQTGTTLNFHGKVVLSLEGVALNSVDWTIIGRSIAPISAPANVSFNVSGTHQIQATTITINATQINACTFSASGNA